MFFSQTVGKFSPNFCRLLYTPIYARLCHIKCDHPACVSADGGHVSACELGGRDKYCITSSEVQIIE